MRRFIGGEDSEAMISTVGPHNHRRRLAACCTRRDETDAADGKGDHKVKGQIHGQCAVTQVRLFSDISGFSMHITRRDGADTSLQRSHADVGFL